MQKAQQGRAEATQQDLAGKMQSYTRVTCRKTSAWLMSHETAEGLVFTQQHGLTTTTWAVQPHTHVMSVWQFAYRKPPSKQAPKPEVHFKHPPRPTQRRRKNAGAILHTQIYTYVQSQHNQPTPCVPDTKHSPQQPWFAGASPAQLLSVSAALICVPCHSTGAAVQTAAAVLAAHHAIASWWCHCYWR